MKSFADYQIDMSYLTLDRLASRAKMDRVDYNLSVGAFHNDEMVGFLLIAIDQLYDISCAFDAGTGVIPEFRGMRIAGSLFDFALPELNKMGVKRFILEVLQENSAAIKVYSKTGFSIERGFNCYKLESSDFKPKNIDIPNVLIKPMNKGEIENYKAFLDWEVSWEYNFSAINSINEDMIIDGAFLKDKCIGFIVFYPTLNWIFMLAVNKNYRKQNIGSLLLTKLIKRVNTPVVKFNNLLPENGICGFVEKHGFQLYTTQFEMVYSLK